MDTVDTTQLAKYVETVLKIYYNMEGTKHMAVAASTLLVYDIISTLPSEAKYIWGSPWTFARIMFHVNRCFSLALMCIYVPTLFMHRLSISTCVAVSLFYTYGTIFVMGIITSVLMVRVWLIYGKNKWVLVGLVLSCALTTIPSIIIFQISLMKASWIPNPAPELITACLFTGNPLAFLPYITSLIYETVIFGLTIYKTWRMSRAYMATPLMTRLLRDGSSYYFIVMISIILTMLGALHPLISGAAIGSGWLVAIMSSMCSRLILSTRAFYNRDDEDQATDDFAMDNLSPLPRGLNNNRAQVSTSSSSGSQVKEWRQPPSRKLEQDAERQDAGRQLACGLNGQVEENKIGTAWSEKVSQHRVYRIGRI